MSKQIDKIKYTKLKNSLLNGNTAKQAALDAGYAPSSANNATGLSSVKLCQEEVIAELKASEVTVELVIKRLNEDRELARNKGDIATMTRVDELLGKYLAMFTDKQQVNANILTQEEQSILNKYISSSRINKTMGAGEGNRG